jgi:hypothetical protein
MTDSNSDVYLVVEDSPVFAALFTSTVRDVVGGAGEVVRCNSLDEAEPYLLRGNVKLVVGGYGLGNGRTAADLRDISDVPMVVMSGRPSGITALRNATIIQKSDGPDKLREAIRSLIG